MSYLVCSKCKKVAYSHENYCNELFPNSSKTKLLNSTLKPFIVHTITFTAIILSD